MLFSPQNTQGFGFGKPADGNAKLKTEQATASNESAKPLQPAKGSAFAPFGGKTSSNPPLSATSTSVDLSKPTATEVNKVQAPISGNGGKLPSTKVEGAAGQQEVVIIDGKIKVDEPQRKVQKTYQSPLAQLKDQLFQYSAIQSGTPTDKNIQTILNSFAFLTSDELARSKALQTLGKPEGIKLLEDIKCLYNETSDVKAWGCKFFSMVISQLMHDVEYISFKGVLDLLNRYLAINKDIFIAGTKFNKEFIIKQCNMKILNEVSSSVKSEPFFLKIVKEISLIKDTIFLQYHRFFKRLVAQDNQEDKLSTSPPLKSKKFINSLGMVVWRNFEHILKAQKKEIKNHFELNIMLGIFQGIINLNPEAFNEKTVKQNIIPTLSNHFKLIESSSRIKIKLLDEFFLHLMLVHPFTSEKKPRLDISFTRYDFLKFFNNQSITLRPIQHVGGRIFIQKLLQYDNDFSSYEQNFQCYVFSSIYNILKDEPQRFWRSISSYRNIRGYIAHLQDMIEAFAQADQKPEYVKNYDYYYESMCRFAQLLNLLCFPTQSVFIQPEKVVKNKYIIRQFISKSLEIIKMSPQSRQQLQQTLSQSRLSTQPIYQYFHRRIIKNPNYYIDLKAAQNEESNLFQIELFGNYLKQYAQYGTSTQNCILAFTRLIQLRLSREISVIMQDFSKNDKIFVDFIDQHQKRMSYLEYIIKCLFKNSRNYIPLARNVLSILKYQPHLHEQAWMEQLLNEFKDLPQRSHPQNISQYALILEASLKFIQQSPKSMIKIQQFFNFKFANRFLCHILEVSFDQKPMYNKYMKSAEYNQLSIAVRLLKAMTQLYRKQKESNLGELVPYEIRKLLESQNKDGSYQITMRNTAISYHLALVALLLSRELKFDYDLHSHYPNMKNQILETLINLNYINLNLKHENSLKVTILYNKQLQDETNKANNIKEQLYDAIVKDPTYLGFQYLISSGSIDSRQKKAMFERVKQIELEESFSNMCSRSHFICVFWNEIQNSKLSIDSAKGWDYVKRQMEQIVKFLNKLFDEKVRIETLSIQDKDSINQILKNIYNFSNLLKNNNKQYYTAFLLKYHRIFFNIILNEHFILSEQSLNYPTNSYQTNILTFFGCRTFIQNQDFQRLINESKLHECLWTFLSDLIKITYKKNYHLQNDNQILQILEFGITFLIELEPSDSKNLIQWLKELKQDFVNRPQRNSPLLTKQIIILILLNSKLSEKIECEDIDFGNKDWLLMMNAVTPNRKYGSILISELFNIYEMHPVFFASTCHYLTETAKTTELEEIYEVTHYRTKRLTVTTLIDVLKKSIQAEKSFYSIWIIEVLIEIFMNRVINPNVRKQFCSDIRTNILTLTLLHERIGQLLSKIGQFYSSNYSNLWECNSARDKKTSTQITFSEKQQLLAYLRLLTFIYFMKNQEKQGLSIDKSISNDCMKIQDRIRKSCLNLIPLLGTLLKDQKKAIQADKQWEKKVKCLQISRLFTSSIKSSGIRQLNAEKASQIWKDRSALDLVNEASNFQLTSLCTLWVSRYQQSLQENKIIFENSDTLENYMESLLKFLDDMKTRIIFLAENKEAESVLTFISKKIYLGSVEVSKEMLFTNMASLSSSLNLKYDEIKSKLAQSFMLVYTLVMEIMKICMKNTIKLDQRLIKMADHLHRSCRKIDILLNSPGGLPFDAPPGSDNRSDMSFTKTRTMWSQRF